MAKEAAMYVPDPAAEREILMQPQPHRFRRQDVIR